MISAAFRFITFSILLIIYIIIMLVLKILLFPFNFKKVSVHILRFFAFLTMKLFNIEMTITGKQALSEKCFICANHSSTVDILVLSQTGSVRFITSVEAGNAVFTGILTRLSDTIFVERRNRTSVRKDVLTIRNALHEGFSAVLFPEGTSSDGTTILKFKSSLFETVAGSGIPVIPICIRYRYGMGFKTPQQTAYYGDMTIFGHILNLCSPGRISADIRFLEPVETESRNRKEICAETERKIINAFHC